MKNTSTFLSQEKKQNKLPQKYSQSLQKKLVSSLNSQSDQKLISNFKKQSLKTEQNYDQAFQKEKEKLTLSYDGKHQPKFYPSTYRPGLTKTIFHSSQVILVYLLYKQKKISLFLKKGLSFEQLIKRMYKQIYIFEKQSYSNSNVILKNILNQITGFQSYDNDLLFDYELKQKIGALNKQKVFVPFKQEDVKMPFKLHTIVSDLPYEGHQFLARNYSNGNYMIVKAIKKTVLGQQKIAQIKKSLKNNFNACLLLAKNQSSSFSQINWFQTKHYLISASEFFPENLEENLKKNQQLYLETQLKEIFIFLSKWLASTLKELVSFDIRIFQRMTFKTLFLSPQGFPIISIIDNVINTLQFTEKRRVTIYNGRRNSQRIQDNFYLETYLNLLKEFEPLLVKSKQIGILFDDFIKFLNQKEVDGIFSFESVYKYFEQNNSSESSRNSQNQNVESPFLVDSTSRFSQIFQKYKISKNNPHLASQQANLITQIKQEIHQAHDIQNWRKNHPRNQTYTDVKISTTIHGFLDFKKQKVGNLLEFKKQEERKSHIKNNQKIYIQEIINQMNKNENFIKTTKQNNLASIGFYLKKSDQKLKKKITQKIVNKYKKFFDKNQNQSDEETLRDLRNTSFKTGTFYSKKGSFSQNKSSKTCSFDPENRKFSSLNKRKSHKNLLTMTSDKNRVSENESKQNFGGLNQSILGKQSIVNQSYFGSLLRDSISKTTVNLSKNKLFDNFSTDFNQKRQKLQELFVNMKDFKKKDKIMLKKKHYGIYLEQAEKQYNKIKALRKIPIIYAQK